MNTTMSFGGCFIGIVLAGCGFYLCRKNFLWVSKGIQTVGTIIDHEWELDADGGSKYPIFRYTTLEGKEFTCTSSIGGPFRYTKIGKQIKVVYLAREPHIADIKPDMISWVTSVGFLACGVFMCIKFIAQFLG